ncbi:hypothetical protein [Bradyrhizobium sp. Tv2a-2]|uniref:hypothetical protein n=1 Tax=Bradyrhizobium sp. Tv2a-2 TaxID=113395 RepID=UPI0003F96642
MFDVYLNDRRDLLVVRKGFPIPVAGASGRWRKRKKVVSVSDDIRLAVQSRGYYMRKLKDLKNDRSRSGRGERTLERRHGLTGQQATTVKTTNSGCKLTSLSDREELRS